METVPVLWKTACLVLVPKTGRPAKLNDYRPAALTSHVMNKLECLFLRHLRPVTGHSQDGVGVDDAVLYFLHPAGTHLEEPGGQVRIMFFDFEKVANMWVGPSSIAWISDYPIARPQMVRLGSCVSNPVGCSTEAPQGTVLACYLFTLYTSDFTSKNILTTRPLWCV